MGNGCSGGDITPDPSPKRRRYDVLRARAPSITSTEMRHEVMKTQLEEAKQRKKLAQDMKVEFAKDREKIKQEYEKEMATERERRESELRRQAEMGIGGDPEERVKNMRVDWSKPESKRIHVVVRSRPLNVREIKGGEKDILYMDEINNECTILCADNRSQNNATKSVTFVFDRVYNGATTTAQLYNEIPYSLTQSFLEGYNCTILTYGQTGSGKSFTMQEDPDHIGIIPRAIVHIFEGKEADEDQDTKYDVRVSYIEIYNEEIRDLLSKDPTAKLEIKGDSVDELKILPVESIGTCAQLLRQGLANRVTSATTMNAHSSRSHAIFTVYMRVAYTDPMGHQHIRKAKLNLVDLAGSERHGKTGISTNSGPAFTESKSINLSLSTLGKCIQALSQEKPGHVPYRESKLTRLLQDSLGGNARTMMIACLSPAESNFEETMSTLKYAHTTKSVNNRPVLNVDRDPKDQIIRTLQNEIKQLRHRLDNKALNETNG